MNWGAFDLNLLIVFDAVMEERNVTRAGGKIGLSQPAVSHALNRLRYMLKDELFIRAPQGMVPTPRAEQLAVPLRRALSEMQLALEPETFVPQLATRTFVLAVNNFAAVLLAPSLVTAVTSAAPGIRLDVGPSALRDMPSLLDRGELDLAIGTFVGVAERFTRAPLLEDSFVVAMRSDHPAAGRKLTAEALAGLSYLEISSSDEDASFVDAWLGARGLARNITHRAPRLAAAAILAGTDMVAVLSRRLAEYWVQTYGLSTSELPFESPVIHTGMLWHRRFDDQPAHLWLRKLVQQTTESR
jgi:DNA-binding transcriptional LysR family regulator